MSKRKSFLIKIFTVIMLCVLTVGIYGFSKNSVLPVKAELSDVQIKSEYLIGEEFSIPNATFEYGGKEYECTKTLVYPDGSVKNVASVQFTMSGRYSICYKAIIDGKLVEEYVDFTVLNNLYTVSGEKSSVTYGTNSYLPMTMEGINLSLAAGDEFTFNKVIDVSDMTENDMLCKFYVTPATVGSPECVYMNIKLTDIYDPDNFVLVTYKMLIAEMSWANSYIYVSAGANGQESLGLQFQGDNNQPGFIYYNENYHQLLSGKFGLQSHVSFTGNIPDSGVRQWVTTFEDNYDYLAINYANRTLHAKYANKYRAAQSSTIIDLDDPVMQGTNLWGGFTTGEVRMSIYCTDYALTTANFFITEIAGYDLEDLIYVDEEAPMMEIDFGEYTENSVPKAYVDSPYKIFDCTAIDAIEGAKETDVKVYYNYYSNARVLCDVKDGCFTPQRVGEYSIVYTAKDKRGNIEEKRVDISCIDPEKIVSITVDKRINSISVGQTATLNPFKVADNNGGYKVSVVAELVGAENISYQIDTANMAFKPMYCGEYKVCYTVEDYTNAVSVTDTVTVQKVDAPLLGNIPELPEYVIKGCEYPIADIIAYDYSKGDRKEIATQVYVVDDGATTKGKLIENNAFTVTATSNMQIYCEANNGVEATRVKIADIPVVDAGYGETIKIGEFLQGNGFSYIASDESIKYTKTYDGNNQASLTLINKVMLQDFQLTLSYVEAATAFGVFSIYLTDFEDETNVLKLSFVAEENNTLAYYVNDNQAMIYRVGYAGRVPSINLNYALNRNNLTVNESSSIDLSKANFNGFVGGFANLKMVFEGVEGNVGIEVKHVSNQPFNAAGDWIRPTFYVTSTVKGFLEKGDTITIKPLEVYDLLDPAVTYSFALYDSKMKPVSVNGVLLDGTQDVSKEYVVTLNEYGRYALMYKSTDKAGNFYEDYALMIYVKDMIAPTVELISDYATSATVGETVKIAKIEATDASEIKQSLSYVMDEFGKVTKIKESFVAEKAGVYTVYYYVYDENNNVAIVSYEITVK